MGRPKNLDELFALAKARSAMTDEEIRAQLEDVPAGSASLTPEMVRKFWQSVVYNEEAIKASHEKGEKVFYFKRAEDYDPKLDRTSVIYFDAYAEEWRGNINTNLDWNDGATVGQMDEAGALEKMSFGGKFKKITNSFEMCGSKIEFNPKLSLLNKENNDPIIPETILGLLKDPELTPYIVKYWQIPITRNEKTRYFQWTEYMPDTLASLFTNDNLTQQEKIVCMSKAITALAALHSKKLSHSDLKFDNVMLDANNNPKLGDLDTINQFGSEIYVEGTTSYMSPEILRRVFITGKQHPDMLNKRIIPDLEKSSLAYYMTRGMLHNVLANGDTTPEKIDGSIDVWSFGIMLLEVAKNKRVDDLLQELFEKSPEYKDTKSAEILPALLVDVGPELATIITSALTPERHLRKSAQQIRDALKIYCDKLVAPFAHAAGNENLAVDTVKPPAFALKPLLEQFRDVADDSQRIGIAKNIFHYLNKDFKHEGSSIMHNFPTTNTKEDLIQWLKPIANQAVASPQTPTKTLTEADKAAASPKLARKKSVILQADWNKDQIRNALMPLTAQFMLNAINITDTQKATHAFPKALPAFENKIKEDMLDKQNFLLQRILSIHIDTATPDSPASPYTTRKKFQTGQPGN